MELKLKQPDRYVFFTIWGNGLPHAEAILEILRHEENLEIIRIESREVNNINKFVFDLYACDTVPIEHLTGKLAYLFNERPQVIIVFAKNLHPEETYVGEGAFRHIQCLQINRIKKKIRDLYNPRINDAPSDEHVIHASDYEEQVDYFLKLLGHPEGIHYLEGSGASLPFRIPYHIPRPMTYTFRRLSMTELNASILQKRDNGDVYKTLIPLAETPHYLAMIGFPDLYMNYLKLFRFTYLKDNHTLERLMQLTRFTNEQVYNLDPILVKASDNGYQILDGVHRAVATLYHRIGKIKCVVM